MKKIVCLLLVLVLCFSLTACNKNNGLMDQLRIRLIELLSQSDDNTGAENVQQPAQDIYMLDFVNEDMTYVDEKLLELGLFAEVSHEFSDSYAENRVIYQSIEPGTLLTGNETLKLTVSKGVEPCPYDYTQKLVVEASKGSYYASASLYEWYDGDWQLMSTYNATVGGNGIGRAYEGSKRTPEGLFKLGVILSSHSLDTNLNTYYVTSSTCVVDDPDSRHYNCIMDRSKIPYGTSYDQIGKGLTNGSHYAFIYIEHNGTGLSPDGVVSGAGSVMGIRGTHKSLGATYGDVDISYYDMLDLLDRLDINKNPMVEIRTR